MLTAVQPLLTDQPPESVVFDFSQCKFLAHHGVTVLGGVAHHLNNQGVKLTLDLKTLEKKIHTNLAQNGLLHFLGYPDVPWKGNSICFRHDPAFDKGGIITYLRDNWLGKGWLNISPSCRDWIIAKVLEIYLNAFEHSQSELGVFSCGQHYPKRGRLKLTIFDLGVGIPHNVRTFQNRPDLPGETAIQWAFQKGTSTHPLANMTRGLGLDLLREFVSLNQGKIQIYSHDGYAKVDVNNVEYGGRKDPSQGTIVNIDLVCDERYYCLTEELPSKGALF